MARHITVLPQEKKRRHHINPDWAEKREARLTAQEERRQQNAERMTAALEACVEFLKPKAEAAQSPTPFPYVQGPPFRAEIRVNSEIVAHILNVPHLQPVLELFSGVCVQNTDADSITLALICQK